MTFCFPIWGTTISSRSVHVFPSSSECRAASTADAASPRPPVKWV